MLAGQEASAPQTLIERLVVAARPRWGHDDERGQVLVVGAQAVAEPGAEAGAAGDLVAGADVGDGGVVIDRLGVHGLDEAQVVDAAGRPRQQLADPGPAAPVAGEAEFRGSDGEARLPAGHGGEALT